MKLHPGWHTFVWGKFLLTVFGPGFFYFILKDISPPPCNRSNHPTSYPVACKAFPWQKVFLPLNDKKRWILFLEPFLAGRFHAMGAIQNTTKQTQGKLCSASQFALSGTPAGMWRLRAGDNKFHAISTTRFLVCKRFLSFAVFFPASL